MSQGFTKFHARSDGTAGSDEMKKKIVETSANSADGSQDYLSRSALHYGEDHAGGAGFTAPAYESAAFSDYLTQRSETAQGVSGSETLQEPTTVADTVASGPGQTQGFQSSHIDLMDEPEAFGSPLESAISDTPSINLPMSVSFEQFEDAIFAVPDSSARSADPVADPQEVMTNEDIAPPQTEETPHDPALETVSEIADIAQVPLAEGDPAEIAAEPLEADPALAEIAQAPPIAAEPEPLLTESPAAVEIPSAPPEPDQAVPTEPDMEASVQTPEAQVSESPTQLDQTEVTPPDTEPQVEISGAEDEFQTSEIADPIAEIEEQQLESQAEPVPEAPVTIEPEIDAAVEVPTNPEPLQDLEQVQEPSDLQPNEIEQDEADEDLLSLDDSLNVSQAPESMETLAEGDDLSPLEPDVAHDVDVAPNDPNPEPPAQADSLPSGADMQPEIEPEMEPEPAVLDETPAVTNPVPEAEQPLPIEPETAPIGDVTGETFEPEIIAETDGSEPQEDAQQNVISTGSEGPDAEPSDPLEESMDAPAQAHLDPTNQTAMPDAPDDPLETPEIEPVEDIPEGDVTPNSQIVEPDPTVELSEPDEPAPPPQIDETAEETPPPPPEVINQAPTSLQLDGGSIAEGAFGSVVGRVMVEDESGDTHQFSISDDRFEVVSGEVKLKDGMSLDHEADQNLEVSVTATDEAGNEITESFAIDVVEMPDVTLTSGFKASYFDVDHSLKKLDDIDWSSPATHEEVVSDVDYAKTSGSFWEGGSKDTFGAKITGNIEVEEGGTFDFHIGGDDGVILFVNGQEVIDNDGLHGFRTRSGEIELEPGTHTIEVRYFENFGGAGLKLEWEGPSTDGRELVTAPDMDDLQTVNGMPVTLQIETTDMDGADLSQSVSGLPEGTIVQSGDHVVEIDGTGSADITGWDTQTLSLTPPVEFTGTMEAQLNTIVTQDDGGQAVTSMDMPIEVSQAEIPEPSVTLETGFKASYFDVDHSIRKLDQLDWDAEPTHQEVTQDINYTNSSNSFWEGGSRDTFGAKIEGEIMVEEGGSFDFFVGGDDGVKLFVDGVEVVNNDGLHAYKTGSGTIELEPGPHDIEVIYFENYGHAGLKLEWEGPGTDGRELVTAHNDMGVAQNGTLEIGLDNQAVSDDATITMSGLPADTIVMCGDAIEVSDGGPIDISGWDMDLIEIAPPADYTGIISMDLEVTDVAFNGQETSSLQTIEIPVGDVVLGSNDGSVNDEMTLIAEADTGDDANWLDASALVDGQDDTAQESDVLQEDIQLNDALETGVEIVETYERQDW